jgi:lipoprotein NlpD
MPAPRLMSRIGLIVLLLLGLSACSSDPPRAVGTYTVKKGDTLYSIAWRHRLSYQELARFNGIGSDYTIKPGQVLRLTAVSRVVPVAKPIPAVPRTQTVQWSWPAPGPATLTNRPNGGQGLTITGDEGQEIYAAAAGNVVYTGTGLLGYGQLVIVKHSDTYLSAYGYTQAVQVREGEAVRAGQIIATMGRGPSGVALYFEIRANGQPIDPTALLPKK